MIKVEIDEGSGFCFGVVTAINKAEEELAKGETLYCLGDIVHNSREVERLKTMGIITINREDSSSCRKAKVLLRAHGEPPETYMIARENNIETSTRLAGGVTLAKTYQTGVSARRPPTMKNRL